MENSFKSVTVSNQIFVMQTTYLKQHQVTFLLWSTL